MKGWLCLNLVQLTVQGYPAPLPADMLAVLAVYRTKKAARKACGQDAVLVEVFIPTTEKKH